MKVVRIECLTCGEESFLIPNSNMSSEEFCDEVGFCPICGDDCVESEVTDKGSEAEHED